MSFHPSQREAPAASLASSVAAVQAEHVPAPADLQDYNEITFDQDLEPVKKGKVKSIYISVKQRFYPTHLSPLSVSE